MLAAGRWRGGGAMQKIAILESEAQAQRLSAMLDEQGIPHVIKSYHDSALDGLFQAYQGWGHVEAGAEHRSLVLDLIADLRTSARMDAKNDREPAKDFEREDTHD